MKGVLIALSLCFASAFAHGGAHRNDIGPENTFLVTMRRAELMGGIVTCVVDARSPPLCQQYTQCLSLLPPQVLSAYKMCRQANFGVSWPQCFGPEPVFGPPAVREKNFDCITANSRNVTPEQRMAVVQAETCLRQLYDTRCTHQGRFYGLY